MQQRPPIIKYVPELQTDREIDDSRHINNNLGFSIHSKKSKTFMRLKLEDQVFCGTCNFTFKLILDVIFFHQLNQNSASRQLVIYTFEF